MLISPLRITSITLVAAAVAAAAIAPAQADQDDGAQPRFAGDVIRGTTPGNAIDVDVEIKGARLLYLVVISRWSGWGDWIEPVLVGNNRTTRLTELPWKAAISGTGLPRVNANGAGRPPQVAGKPVKFGFGVHSPSVIVFEVPAGYTRFKARGGLDDEGHGSASFLVFVDNPVFVRGENHPGRVGQRTADQRRVEEPAVAADAETAEPADTTAGERLATDPHIQMIGGDRLPGVVTGHVHQRLDALDPTPSHLLVEPSVGIPPPYGVVRSQLRICDRSVRRIVWDHRPGLPADHTPGTAYAKDGETVGFRSVQFSDHHVRLLTDEGIRSVPFAEIARLDLPPADPWDAYSDDLARLCPEGGGELIRLQTAGGLVATTSAGRSLALPLGESPQTLRWSAGVQPAWALDLIWFDPQSLLSIRRSRPELVPLSRFAPARVVSGGSPAGDSWRWRVNRNVQGGPLASGGRVFDWGFGVHADCELHFSLPAAGESFRSQLGLDRVVGRGGCVRARVFLDSAESRPLFESPLIVGSNQIHDTGKLPLPSDGEPDPASERTLILQVDSAHDDRPPETDPLDIRDVCNWLEPQLQLNSETLRREVSRRAGESVLPWRGWEIDEDKTNSPRFAPLWEATGQGIGRFVTAAVPQGARLTLKRGIEVGPDAHWFLAQTTGRSINPEQPTRVTVDFDSETVGEWIVGPGTDGSPPGPQLALPLLPYRGRKIRVTVHQTAGRRADTVAWSSLGVSSALPPLVAVFEDDADRVPAAEPPLGGPRLVRDDRYTGLLSLRVDAGGRCIVKLPREIRVRENPRVGEHRYLRFAFRKRGGGRVGLGFDHAAVRDRIARFDAGAGPPTRGSARRLWDLDLPSNWIVQTVDVFADFGPLDVQAVELEVPDGQYALFDHIYFARTPDDWKWLPPAPEPEVTNVAARRVLAQVPRTKGLPAVLTFDRGNGLIGSATLVDGDRGYALTAGHTIAGSRTEFEAYLADGRKVTARRLGINRNCNVGMLKIDVEQRPPAVEVDFEMHEAYPSGTIYLAIAHPQLALPHQEGPVAHLVTVREWDQKSIRTNFQLSGRCRGGPLLDRHGRLIGIHTRRSGTGEFLYTPTSDLPQGWTRLVEGKVWGHWLSGVGPKFGVIVTTRPEGSQITHVFPDSPAAGAQLEVDDWIRRIDGEPVASLQEIARLLANRDPDELITLDIRRERRSFKAKVQLMQHRRQAVEERPGG